MPAIQNQQNALTDAMVKNAPLPSVGDYFIRDAKTEGLAIRIYATGVKSWIVQKKLGKRPVRVVIGGFPSVTLTVAREKAKILLADIAKGIDPILEKKKRIRNNEGERERQSLTVSFIWNEYVNSRKAAAKPPAINTLKSWAAAEKKLAGGNLWRTPFFEVKGLDLALEYDRVAKASHDKLVKNPNDKRCTNDGRTQASQAMRYLRAAFNFAVISRELPSTANPFEKLNQLRPNWYRVNARDGIIGKIQGDLARWWAAVDELRTSTSSNRKARPCIADFLTLTLLWGVRKVEILSLRWENVDLSGGLVRFDATKNGRIHVIPITSHVQHILERRKKERDSTDANCPWVFPSPKVGFDSHLAEPRKTVARVEEASGCKFSIHDLRRTFGTLLNEMGVSEYTVKQALNHAPNDTASRHYLQPRLKELRPIYQKLEDKILIEAGVMKEEPAETVVIDANLYAELMALKTTMDVAGIELGCKSLLPASATDRPR